MFFVLSKLLQYFLMPIIWIAGLLLLAIFLKSVKWRRIALVSATGLLLVFSNPFLANVTMRAWEYDSVPLEEVEHYDVAIILTGVTSMRALTPDRVHTHKGADRFLHPLKLYRMGKVDKFLITGGTGTVAMDRRPEAEMLQEILLLAGVPQEDIIIETRSDNTYQNAVYTGELLKTLPKLDRKLLVTSAFHMRRAKACFDKAGIATDVFPADFYTSENRYTPDELIVPSPDAFRLWHRIIHEMMGYIVYKVVGYA
ncbi:YdcF family protein [Pontibacter sp. JH31]|uniref:YdcF family protein n=1 Tax=Pontibacter aquaedesilientis TaxID=2766980 RepID=A0ABR7XB70_9BACT|nr:YdcF family protein [Pontibacter aquaedesilientis]MBD1395556.1 YdcF family protein [Pontibacter aquaedesilientis]